MTDNAPMARRRRLLLGILVLGVLPLFLRLWPIQHGMPRNHVVDTHFVRGALGMAKDRDLAPPVGRYSTYPNLLPYALLPVYVGEYAVGRAAGAWSSTDEFKAALMERPELAHLPARILVALLAALTPLFVFRTARAMGLTRGAWISAYLVGTGLLHVHLSVQERPWAPMCAFIALSCWPAALFMRSGRAKHLVLSGLAASLAFATHQGGGLALGAAGLAWAFGPIGWSGRDLGRRLAVGSAAVAAFAAVGLLVGYPHLLVGSGPVEDMVKPEGNIPGPTFSIGGLSFAFSFRWASTVKLVRALVGYDPVLVLLFLGGIVGALRERMTRPLAIFALLWAAMFLFNQADHVRYLLPLSVLFAWPAGRAFEGLLGRGPAVRAFALALLAIPLAQSLRLGWVLRQDDTRTLAEAALLQDFPDETVAIDAHGPLPPLDLPSLERLGEHRDLGAREVHRAAVLDAGGEHRDGPGMGVIRFEAIYDSQERERAAWIEPRHVPELTDDPNEALRRLGATMILVVDKTPADEHPPLLLSAEPPALDIRGLRAPKMAPIEVAAGGPARVWDPSVPGRTLTDANLPSELTFPLTQLWAMERPGPRLELHRLPR